MNTTLRMGFAPEVYDPSVPSIVSLAERTDDLSGFDLPALASAYNYLVRDNRESSPEAAHIHVAMEKAVHRREFGEAMDGSAVFSNLVGLDDMTGASDEGEADPVVDENMAVSNASAGLDFF